MAYSTQPTSMKIKKHTPLNTGPSCLKSQSLPYWSICSLRGPGSTENPNELYPKATWTLNKGRSDLVQPNGISKSLFNNFSWRTRSIQLDGALQCKDMIGDCYIIHSPARTSPTSTRLAGRSMVISRSFWKSRNTYSVHGKPSFIFRQLDKPHQVITHSMILLLYSYCDLTDLSHTSTFCLNRQLHSYYFLTLFNTINNNTSQLILQFAMLGKAVYMWSSPNPVMVGT